MLFILGRGRSGTTIMRCLLDAHPLVSVPPESMFVMMLHGRYRHARRWDLPRVEAFLRDLRLETRMVRWKLDTGLLRGRILELGERTGYAEVCRRVYAVYAETHGKPGALILGDKNPHYCLLADRLPGMFPEALFLHVVRDPRPNFLSFHRVRFDMRGAVPLALRWRIYNASALSLGREHPDRYLRVRFEDVLREPETTLRSICGFLDLPFDAALLRHHEQDSDLPGWEWLENASKPIDSTRVDSWRDVIGAADLVRIEHVCGSMMEELGYERARPSPAGRHRPSQVPGLLAGWLYTTMERLVLRLPTALMAALINRYRRMTGSLPGS